MATTDSKLKAAILIVSETASQDPSTDKCIPILKEVFGNLGNDQWDVSTTEIVPDHVLTIQKTIRNWTDGAEPVNLIVTSGGTGFATKDVTPEVRLSSSPWLDDVTNRNKAITPLIDRHAPGLV
jgi:gephyrin